MGLCTFLGRPCPRSHVPPSTQYTPQMKNRQLLNFRTADELDGRISFVLKG